MEHFFEYDSQENLLWFDEAVPVNQSAFVRYANVPVEEFSKKYNDTLRNQYRLNIKKRLTEFLIKSHAMGMEANEQEKERCRQHMISERMRREKQMQCYLELHSLLPSQTKRDKQSIILVATRKVEELKRNKEHLVRQNKEMKKRLAVRENEQEAQINIRVAYPSSGVDSMLEVLKCLKQTGSKTTGIQSYLSTQELSATLRIVTKVGAAEVENAVHKTLLKWREKSQSNLLEDYYGN